MRKLGYPRRDHLTIRRAVGWGDENLLKPFLNLKDLKRALLIYRRHHQNSLIKKSRLFPKARQVLTYLKKKGYRLAVASNRPTQFSWILIRHLKLKKYFDYVLCADKIGHLKPHPEILNKIMQKFSLKAQQTIYVGDMSIDAQAGRRARVKTIIVTGGSSSKQEIEKERPYSIIGRITALLKLF